MKKTTLLFLGVFAFALASCSQDELIQEPGNGSLTTKYGNDCMPSLTSTSISLADKPDGTGSIVSWGKCSNSSHQHTYTLRVTGSLDATYTSTTSPITFPYILHNGYYFHFELSTTTPSGTTETIRAAFTKKDGVITRSDACENRYPVMTGWYEHQTPYSGTTIGDLKIEMEPIQIFEHKSCRAFVYKVVNGQPSMIQDGYVFDGQKTIFTIPNVNSTTDREFKVRIEAYDHYPSPNVVHYVYGNINIMPYQTNSGSISFIEVNKIKEGNSNW